MFSLIKDFVQWFIKKENRKIAFKYFRLGLAIAKQAAKFTPTKKDDEGLVYLVKKTEAVLSKLTPEIRVDVFKHIHETKKGVLKKLDVVVVDKKTAKIGLKVTL